VCNYMDGPLLLSFLFILLASCIDKTQSSRVDTTVSNQVDTMSKSQPEIYTDSTVTLFGDTSYKLTLHIFDTANYDQETNNAILTFGKYEKNQLNVFFRDSMYCMYPDIDFQDFNNDKIKDVLVFNYTGGKANPTYHLYLIDFKNHKLIRIKGFEELPNPSLDTRNNIITSIALSGTNYYSFYRITSKNNLINLGHSFETDLNDSTKYDNAIRKILKVMK
jgi:hypothetical protein